jgi:hypothetical protein
MRKLIAVLLLASASPAMAQQAAGIGTEAAAYQEKIRSSGDLYYGIEHMGYSQRLQGFAYFLSPDWQKGWVSYKGTVYPDVQMKYDLVADELVVLHPNNYFPVTLYSPSVDSFGIAGETFIYSGKANVPGIEKPGFYQKLVNGKLSILAKRSKIIEEKTGTEVEKKVEVKDQFFALSRGTATLITSEESLLQYTGDQARKIRAYLRDKELRFRKQKEAAIVAAAIFYNQSAQ